MSFILQVGDVSMSSYKISYILLPIINYKLWSGSTSSKKKGKVYKITQLNSRKGLHYWYFLKDPREFAKVYWRFAKISMSYHIAF